MGKKKESKKTRIDIFKDLIYPHEKDIYTNPDQENKYEKLCNLLDDKYQEFVDFCDYLSENGKEIISISCFQDENKDIIFEAYDGKSISQLSFKKTEAVI